jgi:hypothetical protein
MGMCSTSPNPPYGTTGLSGVEIAALAIPESKIFFALLARNDSGVVGNRVRRG